MNTPDEKLSALLRASRLSPDLPPRFRDNVWHRIEAAATPARSESWLDALALLLLRPKFAFASVAILLIVGSLLGVHDGSQIARHDAQIRYLASVAPESVR